MANTQSPTLVSRVFALGSAVKLPSLLRILCIFLVCHELSVLSKFFPPGGAYPHLIWLTEGANLAALILFGKAGWAGALLAQWVAGTGLIGKICSVASCAIRLGLAQELFRRFHFNARLERLRDFVLLIIGGGVLATGIGTFAGSLLIRVFDFIPSGSFWVDWRIWWIGDVAGVLILTPLILTWADALQRRSLGRRWKEFGLFFAILLIFNFWLSTHLSTADYARYPLAYAMNPLLIWAALRLGPIGVTTAGLAVFSESLWINFAGWLAAARAHALTSFPVPMIVVSFAWLMTLILAFGAHDLYRTRERVRTANRAIAALVSASPLAIVAINADRQVLQWNHAAQTIFGWTTQEMVGRTLALPEWKLFDDIFDRAFSGYALSLLRTGCFRRNGERMDVHLDVAPMRTAEGTVSAIVAILADVTAQRRMEQELHKRHHLEAMGRLAGGIAHDFNNILSVVLGGAELLLTRATATSVRHRLLRLRRAALQASSLTSRLLAFGRQQSIEPTWFDLNELTRKLYPWLQERMGEEAALRVRLCGRPCPILADARHCEQLLLNLCMNAAEGGGPVQQVELETQVALAGNDTVQTFLSLYFESRYDSRELEDLPESQRSELGLAIAQSIVQEAGATMQITTGERTQRILISFPAVRFPPSESGRADDFAQGVAFRQSGEPG